MATEHTHSTKSSPAKSTINGTAPTQRYNNFMPSSPPQHPLPNGVQNLRGPRPLGSSPLRPDKLPQHTQFPRQPMSVPQSPARPSLGPEMPKPQIDPGPQWATRLLGTSPQRSVSAQHLSSVGHSELPNGNHQGRMSDQESRQYRDHQRPTHGSEGNSLPVQKAESIQQQVTGGWNPLHGSSAGLIDWTHSASGVQSSLEGSSSRGQTSKIADALKPGVGQANSHSLSQAFKDLYLNTSRLESLRPSSLGQSFLPPSTASRPSSLEKDVSKLESSKGLVLSPNLQMLT